MDKISTFSTSLALCLFMASTCFAETTSPVAPSNMVTGVAISAAQQTVISTTQKKDLIEERAKLFGLTKEEWARYEELMKGPQGFKGANADPVMVLGMFARSNAERRKYAELTAHNEYAYEAKMWAFVRAYMEAQKRLYGHIPLFHSSASILNTKDANVPKSLETFSGGFKAGDRILYFTPMNNCSTCENTLVKLLQLISQHPGLGTDIYVTDSGLKDNAVQTWAGKHRIPAKWVQNKVVTLNHEKGELYTIDSTRAAPTVILRRGGQFFDFENSLGF